MCPTRCLKQSVVGTLIVTMGLHAIWDCSVFVQDHSVPNLDDKPAAPASYVLYLTIAIGIAASISRRFRAGLRPAISQPHQRLSPPTHQWSTCPVKRTTARLSRR